MKATEKKYVTRKEEKLGAFPVCLLVPVQRELLFAPWVAADPWFLNNVAFCCCPFGFA